MSRGTFTSVDRSAGCPALELIGMRQEFTPLVESHVEAGHIRWPYAVASQADTEEPAVFKDTHEAARHSRVREMQNFFFPRSRLLPSDGPSACPHTPRSAQ